MLDNVRVETVVASFQEARTVNPAAEAVHAWLEMDIFQPRWERFLFVTPYFGSDISLKNENALGKEPVSVVHYLLADSCPCLATDGHVSVPHSKRQRGCAGHLDIDTNIYKYKYKYKCR